MSQANGPLLGAVQSRPPYIAQTAMMSERVTTHAMTIHRFARRPVSFRWKLVLVSIGEIADVCNESEADGWVPAFAGMTNFGG